MIRAKAKVTAIGRAEDKSLRVQLDIESGGDIEITIKDRSIFNRFIVGDRYDVYLSPVISEATKEAWVSRVAPTYESAPACA